MVQGNRVIEALHNILRIVISIYYPHNNTIWTHEISHSFSFFKKFRVRHYMNFELCVFHNIADSAVCLYRHSTFKNENYLVGNVLRYHLGNIVHISQVCSTITTRRRTDGYKDNIYSFDCFLRVCRESKALLLCISFNNLFQSRLIDGKNSVVQIVDLVLGQIGAYYMVAYLRETTTRHKPNIATPDDTNFHDASVLFDE
mmetsp:Transcript_21953/g.36173  ORF Transcript_21953/g.36173 Transcript_21953/m.36173 type:complete len:200 (-) Transcript_21953:74-673(-)